jgi:hypothetical protein
MPLCIWGTCSEIWKAKNRIVKATVVTKLAAPLERSRPVWELKLKVSWSMYLEVGVECLNR